MQNAEVLLKNWRVCYHLCGRVDEWKGPEVEVVGEESGEGVDHRFGVLRKCMRCGVE